MIIAIDGPSGTGKSTVARSVAKRLGFAFFDTGAMYRSVAWKLLKKGIDPSDREKVASFMPQFQCEIRTRAGGERRYFIEGEDVTEAIREPKISSVSSKIAIYPEVRSALVSMQRKFGSQCDAVFEGRDMGTVVFPSADLKIFLTARPEVRAQRRYRELAMKFPDLADSLTLEEILKEIEERDRTDSTREISPLKQARDAILIDTSDMSVEEVIERIICLKPPCKKKIARMKWTYWLVHTLVRGFFKIFFRLRIHGIEHFRSGPGILIGNHASFYDPPVLSISWPEEVHFLAKASLFRIPLFGWLIRLLNSHPISRSSTDMATFRLILNLLKEGKKVILFPEGGRSADGKLQPLERGLAFLVQRGKVPIFPAYLSGTFEAWPSHKKFPKLFGKIVCAFGSPIEWEEFAHLEKRQAEEQILKRTEEAFCAIQAWLDNGAKGIPP